MSAAEIAHALGDARRDGRGWRCRCPLHQGRSLTLRDGDGGRLLAWCFGGCDSRDMFIELRRRGLLDGRTTGYRRPSPQTSQRENVARSARALAIWHERSGIADIPKKQQKASFGPIKGGAVRLGIPRAGEWLVVGEGTETTLSVAAACAMPGWAALSAGGIRSLVLSREATHVIICADHDATGVGERAARDAAARWLAEGRRVKLALPPRAGIDFNDILRAVASARIEEVRRVAD